MRKLKDVVQQGTDKDVASNLTRNADNLRLIADAIPIRPVNDFVGFVTQRILRYVAAEGEAASTALRKDIKLFAWRTRNILECFLLLKYSISSSKIAEAFCAQRIADEMTIFEGLLSLSPNLTGDDITFFKERAKKCKSVLKKHGFEKASPWRIDKLAEAVGMKKDYDGFYKLYSKFVHPSSWVIVADIDEYDNHHYWEVFILNAQLYLNLCCGVGDEFLSTRGATFHQSEQHPLH